MITKLEDIKKELLAIQTDLEVEMSEEVEEAVYRGNQLAAQMARTGKLLADAKAHRDRKLRSATVNELKKLIALPASSANKYLDALCENENYLVNWADRVNRSCTHQLDWVRTLISKAKAEMQSFPSNA